MGFALALSGRYHDAAEKFHKALSLKSEDTFSTTMLSKIMERLAEEEEPFQGKENQLNKYVFNLFYVAIFY